MSLMARREQNLLVEIERDALDEAVPLAVVLRKCIILGGRSGSERLRDWATLELKGYHGDEDLPDYRVIAAPLMVDGFSGNLHVTHQQIAPSSLPEFAREHITERVELRDGVGGIEALAAQEPIKLMPAGASDLTRLMSAEAGPYRHVESLYWSVSPSAIKSTLDQIRTSLAQLVAELRATTPSGEEVPSAEAADQAVNVILGGKRNRLTINAAQAGGDGSTAGASPDGRGEEEASGFWTTWRKVGAFVVGLATVAGAAAAVVGLH
jgi:AbiTii